MNKLIEFNIGDLVEYDRNPRANDHAVDNVASAIREYGFRVPILAKTDGTIIDGHLRYKAAKKLKLDKVPVIIADDMTDIQIKAFRLSVNKMAELADWDDDLLRLELEELIEMDYDIELAGFNLDVYSDGDDDDVKDFKDADVVELSHTCPKCGFSFD